METKSEVERKVNFIKQFVFPGIVLAEDEHCHLYKDVTIQGYGLTKRELFAAMALQGILANSEITKNHRDLNIEQTAIKFADALINELNKE